MGWRRSAFPCHGSLSLGGRETLGGSRLEIGQRPDWCRVLHLGNSLRDHVTAPPGHPVRARIALRGQDFVGRAVEERDRAVVFNGDADSARLPNHVPEVPSSWNSSRPAVVVGAVHALDQAQPSHIDV
jgi:hypothetical protein